MMLVFYDAITGYRSELPNPNHLWFLSCPYTPEADVKQRRRELLAAIDVSRNLFSRGVNHVTPLLQRHLYGENAAISEKRWKEFSRELMLASDGLIIARIGEWEANPQVQGDIDAATVMEQAPMYFAMPARAC